MTGVISMLCLYAIILGALTTVAGVVWSSVPAIIAGLWLAAAGMVGLNNIGRRGRR